MTFGDATIRALCRDAPNPLGKLKTERMVPGDAFAAELVQRLRFFRSVYPLPPDGRMLTRPAAKMALISQLRDYDHQVCHALGLSTRIVPHLFRHTFATEMVRSGVSFPVLMKLLGHVDPEMTMRYVDVALTALEREFQMARAKPRHLAPQSKSESPRFRGAIGSDPECRCTKRRGAGKLLSDDSKA